VRLRRRLPGHGGGSFGPRMSIVGRRHAYFCPCGCAACLRAASMCLESCRWVESACSAGSRRLEFGGEALPVRSRCAGSGFSRRPWAQLRAVGGWPWYSVCHVVSNDMEWTWRSAYAIQGAAGGETKTADRAGRKIFLPSHYPPSPSHSTLSFMNHCIISQCAVFVFK
jgi:hypothetical protein